MLWSLAFLVTTELSHGLNKILYSSILRSCLGSSVSVPCYVHCVTVVRLPLGICFPRQPRAPPFRVPPIDVTNYMVYLVRYVKMAQKTFSMKTS
jgi:hypothetical protein